RAVPDVVELLLGEEDAAVHRLEAVAGVGEGAPHDHAHGVIEIGTTHLVFEVYGEDFFGEFGHARQWWPRGPRRVRDTGFFSLRILTQRQHSPRFSASLETASRPGQKSSGSGANGRRRGRPGWPAGGPVRLQPAPGRPSAAAT